MSRGNFAARLNGDKNYTYIASLHLEYAPNPPVKTSSLMGTDIKLVRDVVTGIGLEGLQGNLKTREEEMRRDCRTSEPPIR